MTADVLLMGWLHKHSRSTFGHRWSLRYFVLRPQQLTFYRTQAWQQEVREEEDEGRWPGTERKGYGERTSLTAHHSWQ